MKNAKNKPSPATRKKYEGYNNTRRAEQHRGGQSK